MVDDLVRRLRAGLPCGDVKCVERSAAGGCTCGEAADRIEKLEAANLKQSCIKVDDQMCIEKLEAVIKDDALWLAAYHLWCAMKGCAPSSSDLIAARKILEGKDER